MEVCCSYVFIMCCVEIQQKQNSHKRNKLEKQVNISFVLLSFLETETPDQSNCSELLPDTSNQSQILDAENLLKSQQLHLVQCGMFSLQLDDFRLILQIRQKIWRIADANNLQYFIPQNKNRKKPDCLMSKGRSFCAVFYYYD